MEIAANTYRGVSKKCQNGGEGSLAGNVSFEQLGQVRGKQDSKPNIRAIRPMIASRNSGQLFSDGVRKQRVHDSVERNRVARRLCLEHYGYVCQACGLNFADHFGADFAGIIDVHHLNPLGESKEMQMVDPIKDLIPLCPNCHRMIHKGSYGLLTLNELRCIVNQSDC